MPISLGLYLRDLLFIDEGHTDFLDPAKTLINFQKRRLVGNVRLAAFILRFIA